MMQMDFMREIVRDETSVMACAINTLRRDRVASSCAHHGGVGPAQAHAYSSAAVSAGVLATVQRLSVIALTIAMTSGPVTVFSSPLIGSVYV